MLGSIVSRLCRSSLGGSIIFICPDHFLGLFVLWSNWRLRVHVLGHFSKEIDLRGHMPRFTQQEADIWRKLSMGYNSYHVIYSLLMQLATDLHVTPLPPTWGQIWRDVKVPPPKWSRVLISNKIERHWQKAENMSMGYQHNRYHLETVFIWGS